MFAISCKKETSTLRQQFSIMQRQLRSLIDDCTPKRWIDLATSYANFIENEFKETCRETIRLIEEKLLPTAEEKEEKEDQEPLSIQKIFYLKLIADYHLYLAEIEKKEARIPHMIRSRDAYERALELACKNNLATPHPVYLGTFLNYAVLYHEIREGSEATIDIAQRALDGGVEELKKVKNPAQCKDSYLILKLLEDNIRMWGDFFPHSKSTSKEEGGGDDGHGEEEFSDETAAG